NDDWIDEVMHHLNLSDKADANMRALSGGMKRRVLVAQALVHRPPVIVLDEPTAGVDVELRRGLWMFIRQLNRAGHTIVLTTHYLEEAETLCNRVALLKLGRIVPLDTPASIIRRFQAIYLRVRVEGALPPALEGKASVDEVGRQLFKLDDYGQVETTLAALRAAGCRLLEVEVTQPDLEEAFVNLVRGVGQA